MTKKLIDATAKIIRKCYSIAALEDVARELGVTIAPRGDIFDALISAGKAADFGQAVELVAAHLEGETADDDTDPGSQANADSVARAVCKPTPP